MSAGDSGSVAVEAESDRRGRSSGWSRSLTSMRGVASMRSIVPPHDDVGELVVRRAMRGGVVGSVLEPQYEAHRRRTAASAVIVM